MGTLRTDFRAHRLAHTVEHIAVEGGSLTQCGGEDGGTDGHVAVGRFFCHHDGNAQARFLNGITLHHVEHLCREGGVEAVGQRLLGPGVGTQHRPIVADVLFVGILVKFLCEAHLALRVLIVDEPSERTAHLANLLVQRHPR